MDETPNKAVVQLPRQGRALWHLGALLQFKALGSETDDAFWALEGLADHTMSVPLHVHSREDEVWYVEGEITFQIGDMIGFSFSSKQQPLKEERAAKATMPLSSSSAGRT